MPKFIIDNSNARISVIFEYGNHPALAKLKAAGYKYNTIKKEWSAVLNPYTHKLAEQICCGSKVNNIVIAQRNNYSGNHIVEVKEKHSPDTTSFELEKKVDDNYNSQLIFDQQQLDVINITSGRHLILAPPGCGKTQILSERILNAKKTVLSFQTCSA